MHENNLKCYRCKHIIKQDDKFVSIGKDKISGESLYRHEDCKPDISNIKYRKEWTRNPSTKIHDEPGYNRSKVKQETKKEIHESQSS